MGVKQLLAALVAVIVLFPALWVWTDLYRPYRGYSGNLLLEIEPGARAMSVAELLVRRGVLARRVPFLFRYWLGRPHHTLKAGEYLFDRPARPIDVYRKLVSGDVYLRPVVIPEGSDRFDIGRILDERLGINPEEFLRVSEQTGAIRDLDPEAASLEGYLFPDTYRFAQGVSAATVVATMLARIRHVLETKFRGELPPVSTGWHAVITLASLTEKETPDPSERPVISGVFTRRLAKGMPLQCDPTVVYAARLNHRPLGAITQDDLDFDSPYNTYRHTGLPPGPIANPGEASIRAALHPSGGNLLYFVSNHFHGHVFARTLAEHQRNVARYRKEVAALRRDVSEKPERSTRPKNRGPHDAATHMRKGAKQTEQEADHP
jgi:UPF0755 protein